MERSVRKCQDINYLRFVRVSVEFMVFSTATLICLMVSSVMCTVEGLPTSNVSYHYYAKSNTSNIVKLDKPTVQGASVHSLASQCLDSDKSLRCHLLRSKFKFIYGRTVLRGHDPRKFHLRIKREENDTFTASFTKKRVNITLSDKQTDEFPYPIPKEFKSRWRFFNGKYVRLPICPVTTVTPPVDQQSTTQPGMTTSTTPKTTTTPPPPICRMIALNRNEEKEMEDQHNDARRKVNPPASNMRHMTVDAELRWVATYKAAPCDFRERSAFQSLKSGLPVRDIIRHSAVRLPDSAEIGFNWFAWKADKLPSNFIETAMDAWMSERKFFNYEKRTCQSVCRHYLQVRNITVNVSFFLASNSEALVTLPHI